MAWCKQPDEECDDILTINSSGLGVQQFDDWTSNRDHKHVAFDANQGAFHLSPTLLHAQMSLKNNNQSKSHCRNLNFFVSHPT